MKKEPVQNKWKPYLIVGAVLILICVILIFGLPRYKRYLMKKRSTEVRTAIEALKLSAESYMKERGSISGFTVEAAIEEAKISQRTRDRWDFYIVWKPTSIYTNQLVQQLKNIENNSYVSVEAYKIILAVATAKNPLGEGTKQWYVGDDNSFHGYGIDELVEPNWSSIFPNP